MVNDHNVYYKIVRLTALFLLLSVCCYSSSDFLENSSGFKGWICLRIASVLDDNTIRCMLFICLSVWFVTLCFILSRPHDLFLIGLWFFTLNACFFEVKGQLRSDALTLWAGITFGKAFKSFTLCNSFKLKNGKILAFNPNCLSAGTCLIVLLIILSAAALPRFDWTHNYYHGPRWTGFWDNPNIYGILMGAGAVLAIGLLAVSLESEAKSPKLLITILFIATGMMAIGLFFSYSRGAWLGATVGLLCLAKANGKLKWRWVLSGFLAVVVLIVAFWNSTADTDQWYLKRLDLSRPSAQHRVSAWRGALQMMRDHPLGVGWNNAVGVYEKDYSPPENGAAALTMNSYLMLGTELGLPGLLCFVAYLGLCLRWKCEMMNEEGRIKTVCRAGALVFVVAFWFDGGLFDLPTASVFWVLLELGSERQRLKPERLKAETFQK